MSEKAIGRPHAMCLTKHPLRDPALTTRRTAILNSNQIAETTNGQEQSLSSRTERDFMSDLSEQGG